MNFEKSNFNKKENDKQHHEIVKRMIKNREEKEHHEIVEEDER